MPIHPAAESGAHLEMVEINLLCRRARRALGANRIPGERNDFVRGEIGMKPARKRAETGRTVLQFPAAPPAPGVGVEETKIALVVKAARHPIVLPRSNLGDDPANRLRFLRRQPCIHPSGKLIRPRANVEKELPDRRHLAGSRRAQGRSVLRIAIPNKPSINRKR